MPKYVVQKGDTLSSIAQKTLGAAGRYRELQGYQGDPTKLPIGTTLTYGETPAAGPAAGSAPAGEYDFSGLPGTSAPVAPGTTAPPADTTAVTDRKSADAFVNANQDQTIAKADEVPVRGRTTEEITADVTKAVTPDTAAPAAPDFTKTYTDLRTDQGVAVLEEDLNKLNAEEGDLKLALRTFAAEQGAKPLAQRVVEGRVSESEKRVQQQLDSITQRKAVVTDQLKTKYSVIETMMNLKKLDYDTAKGSYDSEYNRNIQTFNLVKGVEEAQKSDLERKQDSARANLQIMSNALKDSNIATLSEDQKLTIRRLELQAGLPVGTIETFKNNNPKADIITSNEWTDASGKQYIAIVSKGPDGKLKTDNVFLGQGKVTGSGGGTKPTEAEQLLFTKQAMSGQMKLVQGADGYVSPENWRKARKAWTDNTAYDGKQFNDNFRSYVNPDHPSDYEGFEEYGPGFTKLYQ